LPIGGLFKLADTKANQSYWARKIQMMGKEVMAESMKNPLVIHGHWNRAAMSMGFKSLITNFHLGQPSCDIEVIEASQDLGNQRIQAAEYYLRVSLIGGKSMLFADRLSTA
jgi:hypothetical protein